MQQFTSLIYQNSLLDHWRHFYIHFLHPQSSPSFILSIQLSMSWILPYWYGSSEHSLMIWFIDWIVTPLKYAGESHFLNVPFSFDLEFAILNVVIGIYVSDQSYDRFIEEVRIAGWKWDLHVLPIDGVVVVIVIVVVVVVRYGWIRMIHNSKLEVAQCSITIGGSLYYHMIQNSATFASLRHIMLWLTKI